MLRWVSDLFREFTDALEWVLARGEDWLRLRGRAGPVAVAVRVVAGLVWLPFAFLLRFYTVVLIEPMVNPLKLPLSILLRQVRLPAPALVPGCSTRSHARLRVAAGRTTLAPFLTGPVAWLLVIGTF